MARSHPGAAGEGGGDGWLSGGMSEDKAIIKKALPERGQPRNPRRESKGGGKGPKMHGRRHLVAISRILRSKNICHVGKFE